MNKEYKCEEIEQLLHHKYSEDTGKLNIKTKWRDGHELFVDADIMKRDDLLHLAHFIYEHPVERLRCGYWNDWSQHTIAHSCKIIQRIRSMYKQGNFHCTRTHISRIRRQVD